MQLRLSDHPAELNTAVDRIDVTVSRASQTLLRLRYVVTGRIADILAPPPAPPTRENNLWRTTCFEAFLSPASSSSYLELNFSPWTQWAAYDFAAYRMGMRQAPLHAPPDITLAIGPDTLTLEVAVSLDLPDEPYRLGLSAVIEERAGALSRWALNHPSKAPDFHHHCCFDAELPPAERS